MGDRDLVCGFLLLVIKEIVEGTRDSSIMSNVVGLAARLGCGYAKQLVQCYPFDAYCYLAVVRDRYGGTGIRVAVEYGGLRLAATTARQLADRLELEPVAEALRSLADRLEEAADVVEALGAGAVDVIREALAEVDKVFTPFRYAAVDIIEALRIRMWRR